MKYIILIIISGLTFWFAFANSTEFRTFVYKTIKIQEEKLKELDSSIQKNRESQELDTLAKKTQCTMDLKPFQDKIEKYNTVLKELKTKYINRKSEDFEYIKQSFAKETFSFYGEIDSNYNTLINKLESSCQTFDEYKTIKTSLSSQRDLYFEVARNAEKGSKFDFFNSLSKLPN